MQLKADLATFVESPHMTSSLSLSSNMLAWVHCQVPLVNCDLNVPEHLRKRKEPAGKIG